jgi:hypothetical protein
MKNNVAILIICWFLINTIGQGYADSYPNENLFSKILSVTGYIVAIFMIVAFLILTTSFLGTIIFWILKKRELFLGFLFSILINIALGLIIYLTQY